MENSLWTYLIAISLLTITPGVDTVLIIRNTTRGGWRDGVLSSLGICSGLFVHALVSAVGISVILLQSAWAFRALRLAGAAYLVWLGIVSLRSAVRHKPSDDMNDPPVSRAGFDPRRSLREGLLSNVLNPKAIVFYMAFLPQFIDPARSAVWQSLFLAGLHFLIAMVWQCLLASAVDQARRWMQNNRIRRTLDTVTGSIMVFFGVKLASTS
ncbi:MAG: LysE family translocator [Desulfobacterales bacterium]|nr:LysE family translocator [Desulfobacterales bacterium]MDJ0855067.1 LysE family translocator [Desulfobacterales bacterium]MDJ0885992.1 LysE family translocator [Desulfobacterales bacterium]MDJ0989140.1 LysE family translocator [Desulfobacterales bacterium]